jgi:starch phosphorylase
LDTGALSPDDQYRFSSLANRLRYGDRFMVAEDFAAYRDAQLAIDDLWRERERWGRMAIMNIAGMGWFSSDRTIAGYARDIWDVPVRTGCEA